MSSHLLPKLFSWIIVRRCVDDWRRIALLLLSVALGVSVFLAIVFAASASIRSFQLTAELFAAPMEIRARSGALNPEDVRHWLPLLSPHLELEVFAERSAHTPSGERFSIVALDLLAHAEAEGVSLLAPDTEASGLPVLWVADLFFERERNNSDFCPIVESRTHCLQLRELPAELSLGRQLGSRVAILDLATLQAWEGEGFSFSGISLKSEQEEQATLAVAEVSDGKWLVSTDLSRRDRAQNLLGAFQLNISIMVLMSLAVCAFTVYNGFQLGVRALLPQLGVLHTLGLPKSSLMALVICEALALGLLGSVLGLSLGYPLSEFISELFLSTARSLYQVRDSTQELGLSSVPMLYFFSLLVGVSIAIVGSVGPALSTRKVVAHIGTRSTVVAAPLPTFGLLGASLVLALLTAGALILAHLLREALFGHVAAFFLICIPVALAAPTLQAVAALSRRLSGTHITPALLAGLSGVLGSARACGVAIATSACGLSLLIGLGVMIASFRHSLEEWVNYSVAADVFISSKHSGQPLQASFYDALLASQALWQVTRFSTQEATVCDTKTLRCLTVPIFGTDIPLDPAALPYRVLSGQLDVANFSAGRSALVSESLAHRLGVSPGSVITLKTSTENPSGSTQVTISGVYKEFSSERGNVLLAFEAFSNLFGARVPTNVSLLLNDELQYQDAEPQLYTLPGVERTHIRDQAALRAEIFETFDRTFAITGALRIIVLIVCALGFAVTLGQLHWDRRRDWRTLQVMGATQSTLVLAVLVEALALLFPSIVLGVPIGLLLASLLVHVINPLSFGWTLFFFVPWQALWVPIAALFVACLPPLLWHMAHLQRAARSARLSDD